MKCPKCQHTESKVNESREVPEGNTVRRRRECLKCSTRWTTYERLEIPNLVVVKKDGRKVPFMRGKILSGIQKAVEKRPVSPADVEEMVAHIEQAIYELGKDNVESRVIGEMVMEQLLKTDDVAYVRFASVYRSFADVDSFAKELAKIKKVRHA